MKRTILKVFSVLILYCLFFNPIASAWGEGFEPVNAELNKIMESEDKLMEDKLLQVLVKYKDGESNGTRSCMSKLFAKDFGQVSSIAPDIDIITLNDGNILGDVIEELKKEDNVELVEKNQIYKLLSQPNDSYFNYQWWFETLEVEKAWELAAVQEKDVVVAVIDSGINYYHPDLENRIAPGGYDFYNNTPYVYDANGHGTAVAGVLAAEVNNLEGIAGICGELNIKVLPLRVTNYEGYSFDADIIAALHYAINNGVDVINLSLGSEEPSEILNMAVQRAINAGIIVVASAGNDAEKGNPVFYPASYPNVISVGSTDRQSNHSSFSNYNEYVDVAAPGEEIFTTDLYGSYKYYYGTSFSAPIVSGIFATMKAVNPDMDAEEIREALLDTAADLGIQGYDIYYGYGMVNAYRAVKQVIPVDKALPIGIKLDKSEIKMSLPETSNIFKAYGRSEDSRLMSMDLPAIYENEPNNSFPQSSNIYSDYYVFGTITDKSDDIDLYRLEVTDYGELKLQGQWLGDNVGSRGWEDDLCFVLLDSQSRAIMLSQYLDYYDGTAATVLEAHIDPGTYYICVYQSSDYKYLYLDEPYVFSYSFEKGVKVDDIFLNKAVLCVKKQTIENLIPEISPLDATNRNLTWSTDNPQVIGLEQNGRVKGNIAGVGEVTVTSEDGSRKASCLVVVTDEPKAIGLSLDTTARFMKKGETFQLMLTQSVLDGKDYPVLWYSNNDSVAKVDEQGRVTAVGRGKAIIAAVVEDKFVQAVIKVTEDKINRTEALFETVLPEDVWYKSVLWQSTNSGVAYVDQNGIITARGPGVTDIVAATSDGAYSSSCRVTVEGINPNWTNLTDMQVDKNKVFQILFNAEVDPRGINRDTLYVAGDIHGVEKVAGVSYEIDSENKCIVRVAPESCWNKGEYYLFITDKVIGKGGRMHKKNLRMKFIVF